MVTTGKEKISQRELIVLVLETCPSNMSHRVAAVVVTHNRKQLLSVCLEALLEQTQPLQAVIIVDDNSTDGTREMLIEAGFLGGESGKRKRIRYPRRKSIEVIYRASKSNNGPAAGFAIGIRTAVEKGFDWVWTMDDDVAPLPDALEKLLSHSAGEYCILGERINPDGSLFQWPAKFDLVRLKAYFYDKDLDRAQQRRADGVCWEGVLLHRDLIATIGYPSEDFFIVFDDTEYGLRISAVYNILHIRDVTVRRLVGGKTSERSFLGLGLASRTRESAWKTYYSVRNLFLLRKQFPRGKYQLLFLWVNVLRKAFSPFVFLDDTPLLRFRLALKGVWDGIRMVSNR